MSTTEKQILPAVEGRRNLTKPQGFLLDAIRTLAPRMQALSGQLLVIGLPSRTVLSDDVYALSETLAFLRSLGASLVLVHSAEDRSNLFQVDDYLEPLLRERMETAFARDALVRRTLEGSLLKSFAHVGGKGKAAIVSGSFYEARPSGVVQGIDLKAKGKVHFVNQSELLLTAARSNIVLISTIGYSSTGDAYVVSLRNLVNEIAEACEASHRAIVLPSRRTRAVVTPPPLLQTEELVSSKGIKLLEPRGDACLMSVLLSGCPPLDILGNPASRRVRAATDQDVPNIVLLIEAHSADGTMVRKNAKQILEQICLYTVVEENGRIIGCVSLIPSRTNNSAELASLAVAECARGDGVADAMLNRLVNNARSQGLEALFALTTQTEQWFRKRGFEEMTPDWLPADRFARYDWSRMSKVFCKRL